MAKRDRAFALWFPLLTSVLVLAASPCASMAAAVDYFLKIDGIEGESTDDRHRGEIELLSWSHGLTGPRQPTATHLGGGIGSGKVSMSDISFSKHTSKATPKLMQFCVNGQHVPRAVLTCRKTGGNQEVFLEVTLTDCIISSYSTAAAASSDSLPTETMSLNFTKIEFKYTLPKRDGSTGDPETVAYDIKSNNAK